MLQGAHRGYINRACVQLTNLHEAPRARVAVVLDAAVECEHCGLSGDHDVAAALCSLPRQG